MSIDTDDEILQDFLVEAGEIQERLNEELVDLEQSPDDPELLNSVFRGFHTIKGGAGFLGMDALVAVCHRAEDVFNVLRQGERAVDPELMDAVLQVLDEVNRMFESINAGEDPEGADPELLETLRLFALPQNESVASEAAPEPEPAPVPETKPDLPAETAEVEAESDGITEDEFEALLDQLHGEGKHGGAPAVNELVEPEVSVSAPASNNDGITEAEFEALLDQLHGEGKHGGSPAQAEAAPTAEAEESGKVESVKAEEPKAESDEISED